MGLLVRRGLTVRQSNGPARHRRTQPNPKNDLRTSSCHRDTVVPPGTACPAAPTGPGLYEGPMSRMDTGPSPPLLSSVLHELVRVALEVLEATAHEERLLGEVVVLT